MHVGWDSKIIIALTVYADTLLSHGLVLDSGMDWCDRFACPPSVVTSALLDIRVAL